MSFRSVRFTPPSWMVAREPLLRSAPFVRSTPVVVAANEEMEHAIRPACSPVVRLVEDDDDDDRSDASDMMMMEQEDDDDNWNFGLVDAAANASANEKNNSCSAAETSNTRLHCDNNTRTVIVDPEEDDDGDDAMSLSSSSEDDDDDIRTENEDDSDHKNEEKEDESVSSGFSDTVAMIPPIENFIHREDTHQQRQQQNHAQQNHAQHNHAHKTMPNITMPKKTMHSNNREMGVRVRILGGTYQGQQGTLVKRTPHRVGIRLDGDEPESERKVRYLAPHNVQPIMIGRKQHHHQQQLNSAPGNSASNNNGSHSALVDLSRSVPSTTTPTQRQRGAIGADSHNVAALYATGIADVALDTNTAPQISLPAAVAGVMLQTGDRVMISGGTHSGKRGTVNKTTPLRVHVAIDGISGARYLASYNVQKLVCVEHPVPNLLLLLLLRMRQSYRLRALELRPQ